MGAYAIKKQLYSYIECDKPDQLIILLKAHPKYVNEEINSYSHHTPLLRAVWKSNYTISHILLGQFAADVNLFGGKYTPLMLAAIRGNLEIIDLLFYFKADVLKINKDGMNAIDLAILFGQYQAALKITSTFQKNQNGYINSFSYKKIWQSFQNSHKKLKLPFQINYKAMIECLNQKVKPEEALKRIFNKSCQQDIKSLIQLNNSDNRFKKQQSNLKSINFLKNQSQKIERGISVDTNNTSSGKNHEANKFYQKQQSFQDENNDFQNDFNQDNLSIILNQIMRSSCSVQRQKNDHQKSVKV